MKVCRINKENPNEGKLEMKNWGNRAIILEARLTSIYKRQKRKYQALRWVYKWISHSKKNLSLKKNIQAQNMQEFRKLCKTQI